MAASGYLHAHPTFLLGKRGRWAIPTAGLDALEKTRISCPYLKSNHDSAQSRPIHATLLRFIFRCENIFLRVPYGIIFNALRRGHARLSVN
jgi:hypothetical protein